MDGIIQFILIDRLYSMSLLTIIVPAVSYQYLLLHQIMYLVLSVHPYLPFPQVARTSKAPYKHIQTHKPQARQSHMSRPIP